MIQIKKTIAIEELKHIVYPAPKGARSSGAGKYWINVPHYDLINEIIRNCHHKGWETPSYKIALSNDLADMAFTLEVVIPDLSPSVVGRILNLGVLNPNSQLQLMKAYCGIGEVLVDRLAFSKKHTKNKNQSPQEAVASMAKKIVSVFEGEIAETRRTANYLKHRVVERDEAISFFVEAARANLVTWSRIGRADRAFDDNDDYSAWGCLVAFKEALKMIYPIKQLDRGYRFREIVMGELAGVIG